MVSVMTPDVLQRFRAGIEAKRFTLTQVAEASGLSITQLSYIKNSNWGEGIFEKARQLQDALNRIEAEQAEQSTSEQGERIAS